MSSYARGMGSMTEELNKLKVLTNSLVSSDIISFSGGAPGKEAYPFEKLREISQDIFQFTPQGIEAVKYGSPYGLTSLREQIRDKLLAPRGIATDIDHILITAGGIQCMNLVSQMLLDPGDVVLVETPTFVHASMIFKMFQAKIVPCKCDDNGLVISDVEEKIRQYEPKMIYTVPTFHNPTGKTLPVERRKALAALGDKYGVYIFEDDPYREIRYSGETLPYIKSFDTTGHVIIANSFSKIFSPGARLGYIMAEPELIKDLADVKLGTDACTNNVTQSIAAEFFRRGYYPEHLEFLCSLYRSRRDALLDAIDKYFPEGTKYTYPDGGYYTWVELPESLNATMLAGEAAEKLNICYGVGSIFYSEGNPEGAGDNFMRLSFSVLDEDTITANIKKLGEFLCQKLEEVS